MFASAALIPFGDMSARLRLVVTIASVSARPGLPADLLGGSYEGRLATGCPQVQLGFRHESRDKRFTVYVMQLSNCSAPCLQADQKL